MLPDFTNLKKDLLENVLTPALEEARKNDPLLGNIQSTIQHEGKKSSYQTVEGNIEDQPFEHFQGEWTITPEDVTEKSLEFFVEKFRAMGVDAASQMAKYSFKVIDEGINRAGNVVDGGGKPISPDLILKSLDKVQIDFDEETGKAHFPTFYIHPDQREVYEKILREAKESPEFKKKFDEMVERKRKEWHDREAIRKLVD